MIQVFQGFLFYLFIFIFLSIIVTCNIILWLLKEEG